MITFYLIHNGFGDKIKLIHPAQKLKVKYTD